MRSPISLIEQLTGQTMPFPTNAAILKLDTFPRSGIVLGDVLGDVAALS